MIQLVKKMVATLMVLSFLSFSALADDDGHQQCPVANAPCLAEGNGQLASKDSELTKEPDYTVIIINMLNDMKFLF
ncbi:MAG: hypothetical protein R2747_20475 [Pyrinomonadaceae bacterium]